MRTKIAILGSTGSIGKNLLEIISNDFKKYEVVLQTANNNYSELIKQAKKFNVKNEIILPPFSSSSSSSSSSTTSS